MQDFIVNVLIPGTVYLASFAAILVAVFFVVNAIKDPKSAIMPLVGSAAMLLIIFIISMFEPGTITDMYRTAKYADFGITEGVMKFVGTGIRSAVIFTISGFLLWIVFEAINFVRSF